MPEPPDFDPSDVIIDGLMTAEQLLGDPALVRQFMSVYPDVRGQLDALLAPGDRAAITIPCINNDPAVGEVSTLVLLKDRAILAWSKGLFRRTVGTSVMALASVREARIGSGPSGRGTNRVLFVAGEHDWELVLFSDKPEFTEHVRSHFVP